MSIPVQPSTTDLPFDPLLQPGAFNDVKRRNPSSDSDKSPNGTQLVKPVKGLDDSSPTGEGKVKRRLVVPPETWLPAGWLVKDRTRSSGATAGTVDKYYVETSTGRRFRSKKEVLYYLETGLTPYKRKKAVDTPVSKDSAGNCPGRKLKKSARKLKPLKFDFTNVPEKVEWFLTNSLTDSWTPIHGDEQVPKSSREDWAAAFVFLTESK